MVCADFGDGFVRSGEFVHDVGDSPRSLQSGTRAGFIRGKTAMGKYHYDDYHADAG